MNRRAVSVRRSLSRRSEGIRSIPASSINPGTSAIFHHQGTSHAERKDGDHLSDGSARSYIPFMACASNSLLEDHRFDIEEPILASP